MKFRHKKGSTSIFVNLRYAIEAAQNSKYKETIHDMYEKIRDTVSYLKNIHV